MKEFEFESLPDELQDLVLELAHCHGLFAYLCTNEETDHLHFKVQTAADPEWGNGHVPLAVYLVKHGANKGETVDIVGI